MTTQRPRSRPWIWLLAGLTIGAGGVLAVGAGGGLSRLDDTSTSNADGDTAQTLVELATATVTTHDLIEEIEWDGTLGYGDTVEITGTAGTVTSVTEIGTTVNRGDTLLHVDQYPVSVLFGPLPAYRNLSNGDAGADVQQLEANLVAMGYDPDGTVTIDDDFTSYTDAMVERWQEDLGVEVTGMVDSSHIVVLPGPSTVQTMATPGSVAGGPIASLTPLSITTDVIDEGTYVGAERDNQLSVSLIVDVSDADEFSTGDPVSIEQADESLLAGTVADVGSDVTTSVDGSATVEIMIEINPNSAAGTDQPEPVEGAVVVKTVGSSVTNALVVPSRALVSLTEGGFAVEKTTGSSTTELVGIEIGAFDDGLVEVVSVIQGDLAAGDDVVVPQ